MLPRRKEIDPDKVAIYIRWSTDDQAEGTTLEVQLEGCRHYVQSQGWVAREDLVFVDDGQSGSTLDRPALNRLRALVDQGEVDCVVVFKMDRLSRSVVDTVKLVLEEWEDRCYVKSAREAIDTTTSQGKMFFYLLMSYAEWERATIRDRTYSGRLRRAQEGRSPGYIYPFGYAPGKAPGTVRVVEAEAEVVRRMFRDYANGVGVERLAHRLNQEGLFPRAGRPWSHQTIAYVLSNPAYKGTLVWGKRWNNPNQQRRPDEKTRYQRDEPLVTRENFYPPLVDAALWDLVQTVKRSRPTVGRGSGRAHASNYLLTGLLRCHCGASMASRAPRKRVHAYYYYCTSHGHAGLCDCRYIRQDMLDGLVIQKVRELYSLPTARTTYLAQIMDRLEADRRAVEANTAGLRARLVHLDARQTHIRREYRDGIITLAEFRAFKSDFEAESRQLAEQVRALEQRAQELALAGGARARLIEQLGRLDAWETLAIEERKELLRHFVASVVAYRGQSGRVDFEIGWRVRADAGAERAELAVPCGE